jgi:2-polyprenyl-3-methyl-5-hydroxy-6-metoxy-1,4-benzoquinol methylase
MNFKEHWDKVYQTKPLNEVSWFQPEPVTSLQFLKELAIPKDAAIIDIGGGDSFFADHLLQLGYKNITVLDISEAAIQRAKQRLGAKAGFVKWVVADARDFNTGEQYDFWHDRAAFHFLTSEKDITEYLATAIRHLTSAAKIMIGTFSDNGPEKCSGLPVQQYREESLSSLLSKWFLKIKCITTDHLTPFHTIQNFLFCSFQKIIN